MHLNPGTGRKAALLIVSAIVAIPVVGCRPKQPIVVDLDYSPPETSAAVVPLEDEIVVHLSPIADERSNRETIGRTTVPILPGSDVIKWVRNGLLTLRDTGFALRLSASDPTDGYRMQVAVTRVYCRSTSASLRATVILSVGYFRNGRFLEERTHRGEHVLEDTSILSNEYRFDEMKVRTALNGSLADAVAQIRAAIMEFEASP